MISINYCNDLIFNRTDTEHFSLSGRWSDGSVTDRRRHLNHSVK